MTFWLPDWPWLGAIEAAWVVGVTISILLERRSPVATVSWILGLALLPGIGVPVYLVFGPRRLARKRRRRAIARELVRSREGTAWVKASRELVREGALVGDPALSLAELAVRSSEAPPLSCEEVKLFFEGGAAYAAILEAVRAATHHVHLEYYIFEDGRFARELTAALVERAKEGIHVRLLVDGLGTTLPAKLEARLREAGAEIARFNPLALSRFRPTLLNFRTHRKIVVVDGRVGFTGGMNVSDDHDDRVRGDAAFRDTHVRLRGDAVRALALVFLEDWVFATGETPKDERLLPPPSGEGSHLAQIVASGPDAGDAAAIHLQQFSAIASAKSRVLLTTAYFVPDEPMVAALRSAARRGVDVQLLLPDTGDHPFVAAAARSFYPDLLAAGVRIHAYGPRVLHAKTLVVDTHYAAVGTANFDNRSFRLNFEVMAVFFEEELADELAAAFQRDVEHAVEVSRREIGKTGVLTRLGESIARIFAPIL